LAGGTFLFCEASAFLLVGVLAPVAGVGDERVNTLLSDDAGVVLAASSGDVSAFLFVGVLAVTGVGDQRVNALLGDDAGIVLAALLLLLLLVGVLAVTGIGDQGVNASLSDDARTVLAAALLSSGDAADAAALTAIEICVQKDCTSLSGDAEGSVAATLACIVAASTTGGSGFALRDAPKVIWIQIKNLLEQLDSLAINHDEAAEIFILDIRFIALLMASSSSALDNVSSRRVSPSIAISQKMNGFICVIVPSTVCKKRRLFESLRSPETV
jgi:hypothetical protein